MLSSLYNNNEIAFISNNNTYTYKDLNNFSKKISKYIKVKKSLIIILSNNLIESVFAYFSLLHLKHVPIILDEKTDRIFLKKLIKTYKPNYIWSPIKKRERKKKVFFFENYNLIELNKKKINLHKDLCLLATTSGSTGSKRLVKQSYINLKSNTDEICKYLNIKKKDKTIMTLPINYTFGMSVLNTHYIKKSIIILNNNSILQKKFWEIFKTYEPNCIYGVPYTFEILDGLKFFKEKNKIKFLAQAGGKLNKYYQLKIGKFAKKNKFKFYIMYGQAEATTRIAYLKPELVLKKKNSIGKSINGGKIKLLDSKNKPILKNNVPGNLVYSGKNIFIGYAFQQSDLAKKEIIKNLYTNDIATRDDQGFYYIVGRSKRFCKVLGISYNLDDIEELIKKKFKRLNFAIVSNDKKIFVFSDNSKLSTAATKFISKKININLSLIENKKISKIPRLENGKINYPSILKLIK
jgi:long-chain acyl-CoA synthetase